MAPRKSGQDVLTRERIVAAALALVDAEGADALSMRRLGAELAVDASSIYYHVPNKAALEDLVVDAVMSEVDLSADDPAAPPPARVLTALRGMAEALFAHPRTLPLFASRSLTTPESLRPIEHLIGVMRETGMNYPRCVAAVNALSFYVLGATTAQAVGMLEEDRDARAAAALAALPAEEFPHITAAIATPGLLGDAEEFELGARAMIAGLLAEG